MIKCLLISTLAYFFPADPPLKSQESCDSFRVEVTVENAPSGLGRVKLVYESGVSSDRFVLHLFADGGERNLRDLKGTTIEELKAGKYILVIVDSQSKYCPQKFDIKINP